MRRTSRGGWLSRLAAKRQKSWVWHPEFEPQNRKPGKSAPVTPCECRAEHGAPICRILRRTRPSSDFTSGGVPFLGSSLRNQTARPLGAAALQGRGDRGREEGGAPQRRAYAPYSPLVQFSSQPRQRTARRIVRSSVVRARAGKRACMRASLVHGASLTSEVSLCFFLSSVCPVVSMPLATGRCDLPREAAHRPRSNGVLLNQAYSRCLPQTRRWSRHRLRRRRSLSHRRRHLSHGPP